MDDVSIYILTVSGVVVVYTVITTTIAEGAVGGVDAVVRVILMVTLTAILFTWKMKRMTVLERLKLISQRRKAAQMKEN